MTTDRGIHTVVRRFKVEVQECGDNNGKDIGKHYEASCAELTGCTVRAGTESEALLKIRRAIGIWIDLADRKLMDETLYLEEMINMTVGDTSDEPTGDRVNGKDRSKKTIVQVTWLDAAHQEDDIEEKDIACLQPVRMVSFGLLMADNGERITISGHVATDSSKPGDAHIDYRDTLVIPRQSILGMDGLGELEVGVSQTT